MTAALAPAESELERSLTRLPCDTASHYTTLRYSQVIAHLEPFVGMDRVVIHGPARQLRPITSAADDSLFTYT